MLTLFNYRLNIHTHSFISQSYIKIKLKLTKIFLTYHFAQISYLIHIHISFKTSISLSIYISYYLWTDLKFNERLLLWWFLDPSEASSRTPKRRIRSCLISNSYSVTVTPALPSVCGEGSCCRMCVLGRRVSDEFVFLRMDTYRIRPCSYSDVCGTCKHIECVTLYTEAWEYRNGQSVSFTPGRLEWGTDT